MSKKKYQRSISATEMAMAERALETGLPVKDKDGRKGKLIQIDRENAEFTYLLRYGAHSLVWIGAGDLVFPDEVEEDET